MNRAVNALAIARAIARYVRRTLVACAATLTISHIAIAATGDMGTGKPDWGYYSPNVNAGVPFIMVWNLGPNPVIPMAPGCPSLVLSASTLTLEGLKMAMSMLIQARALNANVQFFAHASRDGGCGVDYLRVSPQ